MAIKTAESDPHVQTELKVESPEERMVRFVAMETQIQNLRLERQSFVDKANALKNEIKVKEKDKYELLAQINSGQGTIMQVAVTSDDMDDDIEDLDTPSDEELEAATHEKPAEEPSADEQEAATEADDTEPNEATEPEEETEPGEVKDFIPINQRRRRTS